MSIGTEAEQEKVHAIINDTNSYWIGGSERKTEGKWRWTDKSPW